MSGIRLKIREIGMAFAIQLQVAEGLVGIQRQRRLQPQDRPLRRHLLKTAWVQCVRMDPDQSQITDLLAAARTGDKQAAERVFPMVYRELRQIAARRMHQEFSGNTLQPTALVHEAYLRLMQHHSHWKDRAHFFAMASRVMRNVLVDGARARIAQKRGGGGAPVPLSQVMIAGPDRDLDVLAIDQALDRLQAMNERHGRVVEMIFFAGLSEEEIAEVLGISQRTVHRDWIKARAWLHAQLES